MANTFTLFNHNGKEVNFFTPSDMCEWRIKTLLTKEPLTIRWLETFTDKDIFWDIGANIGVYTMFAFLKGCPIYAFEPQHINYWVLNETIRINKADSLVKAYCIGLSNDNKFGDLNQNNIDPGHSAHVITRRHSTLFSQGATILTIDTMVKLGLPAPTKVKIDVDGVEEQIVRGGKNTLPKVHSILTEIDRRNDRHLTLIKAIEDLGFYYNPEDVRLQETGKHTGFGEILFYNKNYPC